MFDAKREQLLVARGNIGNRLANETNAKRGAFARRTSRAVELTADGTGFLYEKRDCSTRDRLAFTLRRMNVYVQWQCSHWSLELVVCDVVDGIV